MDLKIALLVGLAVGLIAAAIWLWPSPVPILVPAANITVEDAIALWAIGLRPNSELLLEAAAILPRIRTDHAATSSLVSPLQPSTELGKDTEHTAQRILVEHVATVVSVSIGGLEITTLGTSPRILVEHAATTYPIGPLENSSGLQSDSAPVLTKLLIEDAETINIRTLKPLPSE